MQDCKVNILGTEYSIKFGNENDYPSLIGTKGNLPEYQKNCVRHEIIHAFMEESGLSGNFEHKSIGIEETTVDWFAIQSPKIFKVFQELNIL